MRTKYFTLVLLSGFALAACHRGARGQLAATSAEMIGLYDVGYEPRGFRQCDDTAKYGNWQGVRFEPGIDSSRWPATRTTDSSRVVSLVRWKGKIERPVRRAAISYPLTYVVVHEVLDVRAARLGDCGWDGN